jgi:hypothetical protein
MRAYQFCEIYAMEADELKTGAIGSLAELRKRFQSNGFGFRHRDAVISIGDGVVLFNSYQIGTDV